MPTNAANSKLKDAFHINSDGKDDKRLDEQEIAARQRLSASDVPAHLNTDFQFERWWTSSDRCLDSFDALVTDFVATRRALDLDAQGPDDEGNDYFYRRPAIARILRSQSFLRLVPNVRVTDEAHHCVVFLQRMKNVDLAAGFSHAPLSDWLKFYFMFLEYCQRFVLRLERRHGRRASIVVILDLEGVAVHDYVNPMGSMSRSIQMLTTVWDKYFAQEVSKFLVVHAPAVVSLLWRLAKHMVSERLQRLCVISHNNQDLLRYVSANNLPPLYGGTLAALTDEDPDTCCVDPVTVTWDREFCEDVWLKVGLSSRRGRGSESPTSYTKTLKSAQTWTIAKAVSATTTPGGDSNRRRLVWQFHSNGAVQFSIIRVATEEGHDTVEPLFPKLWLNTLKLPESGAIECGVCVQPAEYRFVFTAPDSYWFAGVTIRCRIELV